MSRARRRDRGAAVERTALAWVRTGLGYAGVAALLLHIRPPAGALIGVAALVGAVALLAGAELRYRDIGRAVRSGTPLPRPLLLATIGVTTTVLAAGAATGVLHSG